MFGIGSFFSSYDAFGSWAKFNYRGQSGYGTGLGGCCSLFVSLITALFIGSQSITFFTEANYTQSTEVTYLRNGAGDGGYKLKQVDFIPAFTIYTNQNDVEVPYQKYNDETLFDFYFFRYINYGKDNEVSEKVEAISCETWIKGPNWSSVANEIRHNALNQLESGGNQLCPNLPYFDVNGGIRTYAREAGLVFLVYAKDGKDADQELINATTVQTTYISRFFNPKQFEQNGFMDFIPATENTFSMQWAKIVSQTVEISQNEINYYTFPIFDTSSIELINFG